MPNLLARITCNFDRLSCLTGYGANNQGGIHGIHRGGGGSGGGSGGGGGGGSGNRLGGGPPRPMGRVPGASILPSSYS
jgi:hypothetical protein